MKPFSSETRIPNVEVQQQSAPRPGDLAQLVEHLLCKQGVRGSTPLISTMNATFRPKVESRLGLKGIDRAGPWSDAILIRQAKGF